MKITEIDIKTLSMIEIPKPEFLSHDIRKCSLPNSIDTWYCKKSKDGSRALHEVIGQELFRLFIPGQPETRLAKDFTNNDYFVLSQEVLDFRPLPLDKPARLTRGVYQKLGEILITSIFLHEIDLNLFNLGLNFSNQCTKIDGDWTLASYLKPHFFTGKSTAITPELLDNLPYLVNYDAYYWLDIIAEGKATQTSSKLFTNELINAPHFRLEINSTILRIILLPELCLYNLVQLFTPENSTLLFQFLLQRQAQLKESAMQNHSFIQFISSSMANTILKSYLKYVNDFTIFDPIHGPRSITYHAFESDCRINVSRVWSQCVKPDEFCDSDSSISDDCEFDELSTTNESVSEEPDTDKETPINLSLSSLSKCSQDRLSDSPLSKTTDNRYRMFHSNSKSIIPITRTFSDLSLLSNNSSNPH